ncbi:MAG: DUF5667 domain-containing protein [bacterium]|nr:DUF5667 domain-containing protein [bacterium]
MKRFSTIILTLLLMVVFSLPVSASAAISPGIKPGSFFYFFDTAFEKIGLFFTFNPEKKARKALEYADERLAEVEAVAGNKNTEAVKTAIINYESNIAFAAEKAKDVGDKEKAEALLTSIADNTSKHQEVLTDILAKVPDEAKEAITRAIEASIKGHDEAMKKIAELKGEVEQLKQEVAELKTKDEEREKVIEELSNKKSEVAPTPVPVKSSISQTPEATPTPEPVITPTQVPTKTNESPTVLPVSPTPPSVSQPLVIQTPPTVQPILPSTQTTVASVQTIPVRVLKVIPNKPEVWASGFHFISFSFEYLIDGKPTNATITLKSITPSLPIPSGWQVGIPVDKQFSFSTKTTGNYTLTFATDIGVKGEATITVKQWINKEELEVLFIRSNNTDEATNNSIYYADIPNVLLGTFKIRTNPDIDFRLYDCSLSTNNSNVTFGSYKITGAIGGENNNCFLNTGYAFTDSAGLSTKEFNVYLNDLRVSYVNNPGPVYKIRFYLKDLTIQEVVTGIFHRATSSLAFDLEVLRYQ